jgi:hypothetical protein
MSTIQAKLALFLFVFSALVTLWLVAGLVGYAINGRRRSYADRAWFWDEAIKYAAVMVVSWLLTWVMWP